MGRPKGSKNKKKTSTGASASASASSSGARKAVATGRTLPPTNFADTSLGAGTDAGSKARATARADATRTRTPGRSRSSSRRTSSRGTVKADWSNLRFGILLGETKAIKKAFASQEDALGYVKSLPVAKQSKAKLVTVQELRVETSISILPVHDHAAGPDVSTSMTELLRKKGFQGESIQQLSNTPPLAAPAPAPAALAVLNKATDAALQASSRRQAAPKAAPAKAAAAAPAPAPAVAPSPKGNGSGTSTGAKTSRLDLIAARAAKLGHTPAGSAKADVAAVAVRELAVDDEAEETTPEDNDPDLSATDE